MQRHPSFRGAFEPTQRPIGVTVAALAMLVLTLSAVCWALILLFPMLRGAHPWDWPDLRELLASLAIAVFSAGTARGLQHLRQWGASCALLLGAFCVPLGLQFAAQWPGECGQTVCSTVAGALRRGPIHNLSVWTPVLLIVLGAWWFVYFNLKSVRWAFIEADVERRIGLR